MMLKTTVVAALACVLFVCCSATTPLSDWKAGRSTWYLGIDDGACGYGSISTTSFPYGLIAAPNEALFNLSGICGGCFEVQGPSGSVIVQATDECPVAGNEQWCSGDMDHFDLSKLAFSKIADLTLGHTLMQYRQVVCPVTNNVQFLQKDGINDYWFAFTVQNALVEVFNVEVKDSRHSNWVAASRTEYNYWVVSDGIVPPTSVRITSQYGEVLTINNAITQIAASTVVATSAQFSSFPTVASTATSAPTSAPTVAATSRTTTSSVTAKATTAATAKATTAAATAKATTAAATAKATTAATAKATTAATAKATTATAKATTAAAKATAAPAKATTAATAKATSSHKSHKKEYVPTDRFNSRTSSSTAQDSSSKSSSSKKSAPPARYNSRP